MSETLETTAFLSIRWWDPRLIWHNRNVGHDVIMVPQNSIWRPDITLKNSHQQYVAVGNKNMYVSILNGSVAWDPYEVFTSRCDLNMKHFPFDVQTCELHLAAWSFVYSQVQIRTIYYYTESLEKSSQFDFKKGDFEVKRISNTHVAIFKLQLTRKPAFVMMTTVLPIIMLGVLNICVFVLPFHSGEKISYAVTILLALVVALTFVSTIIPDNSDSISYLALYVACQAALSTIQTIITICLCRMYNYDSEGKPVPRCLMFLYHRLCCARNRAYDIKGHNDAIQMSDRVEDKDVDRTATENGVANEEQGDITWADIVKTLDKVCLVLFSLVIIVFTTLYFTLSISHLE